MTHYPREKIRPKLACKIPMAEFNHLTLAEVAEFERYEAMYGRHSLWNRGFDQRYHHLLKHRVCPDRPYWKPDDAE